jgi:hypothetical protein
MKILKLGLIINSDKTPIWVSEIIKEISLLPNIQWVTIAKYDLVISHQQSFAFTLFEKFDYKVWPGSTDLSSYVKTELPINTPIIKLKPIVSGERISFTPEDLDRLKSFHADLFFDFSSELFSGEILRISQYGIWSLNFSNIYSSCFEPAGFWEWFYKKQDTGVTVFRMGEIVEKNEIIARAITETYYVSYRRNQTLILSKTIELVIELVNKLAKYGHTKTLRKSPPINSTPLKYLKDFNKYPGTIRSVEAFLILISRAIKRVIKKSFFIYQWAIFFELSDDQKPSFNFQKFTSLIPPKDRFWADPFVVSENNKHYIFIEELIMKTDKGHLSCIVLDEKGKIVESKVILDKPYHLSYPFVFQHQNKWYMIPESSANMTVDLYECEEFPFNWRFKRTLISNIKVVDATIHFYENRYWLFCAAKERKSSSPNVDMHIYYSDDCIDGEWIPHTENPVVSDPYSARSAGKLFYFNQDLCRPSQICVPRYGYGMVFNRIIELSKNTYIEEPITTKLPQWRKDIIAQHTINFTDKITVIDVLLERKRFL